MSEKVARKRRVSKTNLKPDLSQFTVHEDNIDDLLRDITAKDVAPTFIVVDLFCGAGGTTTGFARTNGILDVIACVNHDHLAIKSHWRNHPSVLHFEEDIRKMPLHLLLRVVNHYRKLYKKAYLILWASLECTNFSKAKGGQSRDQDSRTLANGLFQVWDESKKEYVDGDSYIQVLNPDYVMIENVVEFMAWGPMRIKVDKKHKLPHPHWDLKMQSNKDTDKQEYQWEPISTRNGEDWLQWRKAVCSFGYYDEWKEINAADLGAYTSRNRLFGIFAKKGLPVAWPVPTHAKNPVSQGLFSEPLKKWKAVKEVLDFTDEGYSIFYRSENMNIPKRFRKNIEVKSLERFYEGMIKHIAGGKEAFLSKYYGGDAKSKSSDIDSPADVLRTKDGQALVKAAFIGKYHSSHNNTSVNSGSAISDPCPTVTTRGLFLTQASFISQRNGGNPESKIVDVDGPARILTATGGNQDLVKAVFLTKYNSNDLKTGTNSGASVDDPCPVVATQGRLCVTQAILQAYHGNGHNTHSIDNPSPTVACGDGLALVQHQYLVNYNHSSNSNDIDHPAPTLTCRDNLGVVKPEFYIDKQYSGNGNNANHQSVNQPAGAILKNDKHSLMQCVPFIDRQFSSGTQNQSINSPMGALPTVPKANLITPFVASTNYTNVPTSIDDPLGVITANRKWHYLLTPSWGGHSHGVTEPSPVLVARQDKAPIYLISCKKGPMAIPVYDDDSEILIKIKEFMVLYNIRDIKMRMLRVPELLQIQGFPKDYHLEGTQSDKKKFVGNSVETTVAREKGLALHNRLQKCKQSMILPEPNSKAA